ncbi:hypothetical protein E8E14_009925 [Neopestalotiopsis sp. 37M]|nr:hypothetical protein E8E14_009925 [Neopestalotiopsis sp. 37M]
MSANSLSHLLHANAGPDVHRTPGEPDNAANGYAIPSPSGRPGPSLQPQHHVPIGHIANPYTATPLPPSLPLPPTSIPQAQSSAPTTQPSNSQPANNSPLGLQTPSARSHTLTQSLYQCADCQRRYSRPEHLARHIQTQLVHLNADVNVQPDVRIQAKQAKRSIIIICLESDYEIYTDIDSRTVPLANDFLAKCVEKHLLGPIF